MYFKRLFSLLTLSVFIVSTAAAQASSTQDQAKSDQEKSDQKKAQETLEKKALILLDEILKEAAVLRLAENRIHVQATAADLLWKHDEKRARALFKQATDGFIELLASEGGAASPQPGVVIDGGPVMNHLARYPGLLQARISLQQEILQLLTNRDARLARDFLRAVSRSGNRENPGYGNMNSEPEMDLNLAAQIAAKDPKQALQIAEEHLEKGFPTGLANVLSQLRREDKETAAKLSAGIVNRLRSENLATNQEASNLVLLLLSQAGEVGGVDSSSNVVRAGSTNSQASDEHTMRELVDMLVTAALNQSAKKSGVSEDEDEETPLLESLEALMPQVEKYAPSRAPALRKKIAEYESAMAPQAREYKQYETIIQKGDSQALIDAAAKAGAEMKGMLAVQAIMKAVGEGEFDRARQMTNEHVTDEGQRKQLLASIDRQMLDRSSALGKLDEVRPLLSLLTSEERAALLVQFAVAAIGRNDKKLGLQILDEARGLIGAQAANYVEFGALLQIARSYAAIEPARSFDILEQSVEQLNALLSATAALNGFEPWQYFKDGELIGTGPSAVVNMTMQCASDLALLSRADFDRAKAAADRFNRVEVRIKARMFVARGALSNQLIMNLPISQGRFFHTPF